MASENLGDKIAARFNKTKTLLSAVSPFVYYMVALIWTMGAIKYERDNWRKGMPFSDVMDSFERHYFAWKLGEENDSESGLHHLAHAAWNILVLLEFCFTHPEMDDRVKYPVDIMKRIRDMESTVKLRREEYEKEKIKRSRKTKPVKTTAKNKRRSG